MLRTLVRFARAKRGNVSMIFALSVIPFMIIAGLAVDIGRAILVRERLGHALDAAILAVGASPHLSEEEAQLLGEQFFHANFDTGPEGVGYDVNVSVLNDTVTMTARADVPTTLLALINKDTIGLYMDATAVRGGQDLELVMVLDNTGSMSGSKISALRDAAETAVEMLFDSATDPDSVKIGLVPFAATVNIGTAYETAWWMDQNAQSPIHYDSHNFSEAVNRWELFDAIGEEWAGCVEAREIPHDVEDTAPSLGDPATLFIPYFMPDVPGDRHDAEWGYSDEESWLDDGDWEDVYDEDGGCPGEGGGHGYGCGGHGEAIYDDEDEARQAFVGKYFDDPDPWGDGPNSQCIDQDVVPLTTNQSTLLNEIDAMEADGYTNIPNGLAWGVRLLSPGVPFTEGSDWGTEEMVKAIILLTDGDNVLDGRWNHNMSRYGSYGWSAEERLRDPATSSDSQLTAALDDRLEDGCEYAKDIGARIYTITFQVSSSDTRDLMEACASTDEDGDPLYWDSPTNAELEQTFAAIARDLVSLRLSQ